MTGYITRDITTETRRQAATETTARRKTKTVVEPMTSSEAQQAHEVFAKKWNEFFDRDDVDSLSKLYENRDEEWSQEEAHFRSYCAAVNAVHKERNTKYSGSYSYSKSTHHTIFGLLKEFGGMISQLRADLAMVSTIHALRRRKMEKRIEELEAKLNSMPAVSYAGTHSTGRSYSRGMLVTHKGSLWHAQCATTDTPGESDSWRLCVKAGRDGRDAR